MIFQMVVAIVKFSTDWLCRIDAPDIDKVPERGPLIVISNHTGQLEVAIFFAHLQPRPMTGWAKMEAWDNAFLNWLFNLWGLIPVRRGEGDTSALRRAIKALEDGYIFGIAPEGTRNKTGRLNQGRPGAVLLAVHSGAPILPVAHWGGESFLKNLPRFRRTDFHIRVGEPFRLKLAGIRVTREIRQQIADEMMIRLAELLPPQYRGAYEKVTEKEKILTESVK
ncbi:MAG TPA: lysophospholipid acyltransferase family protein [Anaerolineales bacterium]|nr:lysophospholipid acyltransferase family protein [Anaerolineales bacterium]